MVMQIHVIKTVYIVIAIKGSIERGGSIIIFPHHLFMLSLGIPTHIIPQINAAHAHGIKVMIIRITILPNILFLERIKDGHQVVGLMAHQVMIFPIPPSHFDLMFMREHAHLLKALMCPPYNQRNLIANSCLHWKYRLSRKNRPVDTAKAAKGATGDLLYRNGIDVLVENVAVKPDAKIGKIANT